MKLRTATKSALVCGMILFSGLIVFVGTSSTTAATTSYTTFLNKAYCTGASYLAPSTNALLNLYIPTTSGKHPVVLWVPGGGWNTTAPTAVTTGSNFATLVGNLTQAGIAVASVGYDGFPAVAWPTQIEEVKCAVRYLRSVASNTSYNLNPYQIGAYGRSAGAHLTDLLGLASNNAGWDIGPYTGTGGFSSAVKAVVDVSGPANLTRDVLFDTSTVTKIDQVFGSSFSQELGASPVKWINAVPPRFLILQGLNDTRVLYGQATEFEKYLQSKNVQATLILVDNAGHGLKTIPPFNESPTVAQTNAASVNFFQTTFAGTGASTFSVTPTPSTILVGQSASANATLSGGTTPTGTITFSAFTSCTGQSIVYTKTITITSAGTYNSGTFTPSSLGTYYWTAAYSGDSKNSPSSTPCGASGTTLSVTTNTLSISVAASPSVIVFGQSASATSTLGSGSSPTGTLTFALYNATGCASSSQVYTSPVTVSGNGVYSAGTYTPLKTGTYYWTASYTGDGNNLPASTTCGGAGGTLTVSTVLTNIAVTSLPNVITIGASAGASASLTSGTSPTGSITFTVYSAAGCASGSLVFTSSPVAVAGDGVYNSGIFSPTKTGTYYWVATYTGDLDNSPSTSDCGEPTGILTVSTVPQISSLNYTDTATNGDPTLGSGTIVFRFTITNYGSGPVSLGGTLTVSGTASISCTGGNTMAVSGSLAAGASTTISITCTYSGTAGQTVLATMAATFTDSNSFVGSVNGCPATSSFTIVL